MIAIYISAKNKKWALITEKGLVPPSIVDMDDTRPFSLSL